MYPSIKRLIAFLKSDEAWWIFAIIIMVVCMTAPLWLRPQ